MQSWPPNVAPWSVKVAVVFSGTGILRDLCTTNIASVLLTPQCLFATSLITIGIFNWIRVSMFNHTLCNEQTRYLRPRINIITTTYSNIFNFSVCLNIRLYQAPPRSIQILDGVTIVPGSLVVKPVFYSHCYADESDLDPYFLNKYSSLKNQFITAIS